MAHFMSKRIIYKVEGLFIVFYFRAENRGFTQGWYAVVAVDYWRRRSPISEPVIVKRTNG